MKGQKFKKPKKVTLVGICVRRLLIYLFFMLILYQGVTVTMDRLWSYSFPEISDYLSYSAFLSKDKFNRIPKEQFANCDILIFGEKGQVIYSSDEQVQVAVSSDELHYIPELYDNYYYSVMSGEDNDVWVFRIETDEEKGTSEISDFCRVDSDYNIIEGSLFNGEKSLTERTLRFLQGNYSSSRSIVKYEYTNCDDEKRTLVFMAPTSTSRAIEAYFHRENLLWLLVLLIGLAGLLITAIAIARRVRKSLLPLNTMIEDYSTYNEIRETVIIPGELTSIEESFIDMTEKLETASRHRLEAEQEKNRMIADLSHDLKSPLTVIQGYAQALESGRVNGTDTQKYLNLIRKKADISVAMINNLMQYATMEHPDYQMNPEQIDFCEFLRVCLAERYEELEDRKIELQLELPEEPVYYPIDRRIMGSVMENLINNTIRYNEGPITLFLSLFVTEKEVVVMFADSGAGIPEEIRKDVFKPFVTGDKARTSGKGTGIGMSIIRRGVEMHGGKVELLDPQGNKFSTIFEMRFPLQKTD